MSDETKPDFDPRFSPAFQRGFDPDAPVETAVRAPAPRIREEALSSAPLATQIRVPATPPAVQAPTRFAPAGTESSAAPDLTVVQLDEAPETTSAPDLQSGRNPFLVSLVVISAVLIAAGIWLFVRSGAAFNSREVRSQGDYISLDATIHTAPFIAILGGATAIGVLFVFAIRWRKRR